MKIIYLDTRHLPEVVKLEKQAFGKNGLTEESLHSFINAFYQGCFVAVEGDVVLGYITSERHRKMSPIMYNHNAVATHEPDGSYLYISGIAVDKRHRGKGIGTKLVEKIKETALETGCYSVYIILDANHPYGKRVFNFWRKNGFTEKQRLEWAFQKNIYVEGILFECNLFKHYKSK